MIHHKKRAGTCITNTSHAAGEINTFVISVPTLDSRIHRREDGMDSPREAALCGDCRGKNFNLSTHAFYVYYDSLMANGTDEDRVAVAV